MLHCRITMYSAQNKPIFEARLNENKKYDILYIHNGDRGKTHYLKDGRNLSSKQVMNLSRKLRAKGGKGTVFN